MRGSPVRELLRRRGVVVEPGFLRGLFPAQRLFVDDTSKKKAALCTRRSGKTEGLGAWFLQGAEDSPGGLSVYIARSRADARMILWNTLLRINSRHRLGLQFKTVDQQLIVETQNEHRIWLAGCSSQDEIGKFRGVGGTQRAGIRRVAIDEAQTFPPWLSELVDDALEPALLDQDGDLAIVGTPGPLPVGPFYQWTTGDGAPKWPTHTWSVLDNPYLPHAGAWLEQKRIENRWTDDHPTFQREWLGRWVLDRNALVYPFDGERNTPSREPGDDWERWLATPEHEKIYILSIDLGAGETEASTAFCIIAVRRNHPGIYILKCWRKAGMTPSRIAAEIARIRTDYRIGPVVVDAGGLGVGYVKEFNERYGLGAEAAQKQHKRAYIEIIAGELLSGTIKADPFECRELIDEWLLIPWDEKRELPDDRFTDHCADAALYGCRAARAYYRPEEVPPEPGSPEALAIEMKRVKREAERKVREMQRKRGLRQ